MSLIRGLAVSLGISAALSAQSYTAVVVGSGYQTPPAILIAPGQIATFFVGGLPQTAAGLAKMAAQISVAAGQTQAIPVLSNQSVGTGTLAITVQFPFSGVPVTSSTEWFTYAGPYTVQFGETDNPAGDLCAEGACTGLLPLEPVFSSAHLVNMCDLFVTV